MTLAPTRLRPSEVLLVEDNPDDVMLTREGFLRAEVSVRLHHVPDGPQCLAFLRKEPPFEDAPTPDLVLLDLNLPAMSGREVLAEIIADDALRATPVVILSTSTSEQDIADMYALRCNSYIPKPVDFTDFQRVIAQFGNYWFAVVALPPRD